MYRNRNIFVSYNEKLQWLKLHDRNPEYVIDVDKYAVRDKISKVLSDDVLIPVLGVYESPEDIAFDRLPKRFVMKCTHGTHCSIICRDKDTFDFENAKRKLNTWLKHNYYYDAREWPYKEIPPRSVIEQFISDAHGDIIDYKFMCFHGKVKLILVHQDINNEKGKHTLDLYTPDWKLTEIEWGIPRSGRQLPRPDLLDECFRIAEILSRDRAHVRVDLYIVDGHVYFGELTYYTAAGFKPFRSMEDDIRIGSWISLERIEPGNERNPRG